MDTTKTHCLGKVIKWKIKEIEYVLLMHKFVINIFKNMHSLHSESMVFSPHFMYVQSWVSYVTFRTSNFLRLSYFSKKSNFLNLQLHCTPFFLDLALRIRLSLFLIIWYWSSNQFCNNITDNVNYTFSQSHSISFWI